MMHCDYEFSVLGFCSMSILLLKGWIQTTLSGTGYQGVLPGIRMASIIEYVIFSFTAFYSYVIFEMHFI
jgi:hypothetical protein